MLNLHKCKTNHFRETLCDDDDEQYVMLYLLCYSMNLSYINCYIVFAGGILYDC